jgi:GT2 family glycosyltransferase
MLGSKHKKIRSISTKALASKSFCLDESALYLVSLDGMPSLHYNPKDFPQYSQPFWSLPHGYLPKLKQVTIHPERPNALWVLQRYGYGSCVYVQGNLLTEALASLPEEASLSQEDVLHGVVFYLARHHAEAYLEPPNKPLYTCDDESKLNAHSFLDNPDLQPWLETQANALGVYFENGVLQPLLEKSLPLVSILLPFRDAPALLKQVLDSLLAVKDESPPFEIIGINNQSQDPETLALMDAYAQHKDIRFIAYDAPFNYAAMMNLGVKHASGELILQLNNDIELITPNAVTQLASWAMFPKVGAVGATLFYPDGSLQHMGCHLGICGHVGHLFRLRELDSVPKAWSHVQRPVIAVTGAMLMMRKAVYLEMAGMNEEDFQITYNDIDLCLKSHEKGYTNLCLGSVQAIHYESISRKKTPNKIKHQQERVERQAFHARYAHLLQYVDPTFSRGFDMTSDTGNPSSFLWKSPLKRRLLKGRIPFTPWRFSFFRSANGAIRLILDEPSKGELT